MKKSILLRITIVSIFLMASLCSYSQQKDDGENMFIKDGVEFWHKWKTNKCFNKKNPLQLNVKVKNTNTYCVNVQLQVIYYQSGILKEQSDTISLCINPNQSRKGSKNRLNFSSGNFNKETIKNAAFTYEVIPIQIIKMRSCQ